MDPVSELRVLMALPALQEFDLAQLSRYSTVDRTKAKRVLETHPQYLSPETQLREDTDLETTTFQYNPARESEIGDEINSLQHSHEYIEFMRRIAPEIVESGLVQARLAITEDWLVNEIPNAASVERRAELLRLASSNLNTTLSDIYPLGELKDESVRPILDRLEELGALISKLSS